MHKSLRDLRFIAIFDHSSTIRRFENFFFSLADDPLYMSLYRQEFDYPLESHDIFWNEDESLLDLNGKLKKDTFPIKGFYGMDTPLIYGFFNEKICVLQFSIHWGELLNNIDLQNSILHLTRFISDEIGDSKEYILTPNDDLEDYPGYLNSKFSFKEVLNLSSLLKFNCLNEIIDYLNSENVKQISKGKNINSGFFHEKWS